MSVLQFFCFPFLPSFILIIDVKRESPIRHHWSYFKAFWGYWNSFFYTILFQTNDILFSSGWISVQNWHSWQKKLHNCPEENKFDLGKYSKSKRLSRECVEGTATHSSILAWRIPWTEQSGGLQSTVSHRVGHNWSNLACVQMNEVTYHLRRDLKQLSPLHNKCSIQSWQFSRSKSTYQWISLFPGGSGGKASAYNVGGLGLIPLGRSPGEGNGNLLQYSWLENPMDPGSW